jgi:hypothetical protein
MVEKRPLTDSELDAALAEAFAAEPTPAFAARLRARIAEEGLSAARPFPYLAATAALGVAVIAFVVVIMIEWRPVVEPRIRVVATSEPDRRAAPGVVPTVTAPPVQRAGVPAGRSWRAPRRWDRDDFQKVRSADVLIPAGEQQALRRLLDRPPTAVLRLAASDASEPVVVGAIVIPPLEIDPLSHEAEEGGHQ